MVEHGTLSPGWYPDPMARAPYRWWDGSAWTDGLSDDQVRAWSDPYWVAGPATGAVPPRPAPAALGAEPTAVPERAWYQRSETRWLAAGAVVLIGLLAVAAGGSDGSQDVAATETAAATTAPRPTTTERIATTSTTSTTSTTAPPTTTAAPTTTAPPTTTSPPTTAPPTTAPPAPPPTVAAAPLAGGGCHPSYDPCVPYASDVDCAGGSGNGPAYTGRVDVIGPDVYDLDRDGDGVGCEDS